MFENLSERLSLTLRKISGRGRLTEDNIKNSLREVQKALLEADVALPIVKNFISRVKENSIGKEINKSFTPGQEFIKIIHAELIKAMGDQNSSLNLAVQPPAVVLIVGLQGSGKTTSVGKLGRYLYNQKKKKVLMVSADVYRPAAIKQLETLASNVGISVFSSTAVNEIPLNIVREALNHAKRKFYDVLLIDTAGFMHTDKVMMSEIIAIHSAVSPIETLFVLDAMTGQDAANVARTFNQFLPLTGIILTKLDSDTRGGAALSIRYLTGKSIKFIGVGEQIDALEPFYPDRIAGRILGMGDVLSLIDDISKKIDFSQEKRSAKKIIKEGVFEINDFLRYLQKMRNIGGIDGMRSKLPANLNLQIDDKLLNRMEAIINSMTAKERLSPEIIKGSRKRRIAGGSGMQVQDINRLLKHFNEMQKIMKRINKNGIEKMIYNLKEMITSGVRLP
ncbi:signal recognition particle subunit FFH/SRP54 (srp54) [secondary endosymbiont of Heteropsylla cubana]|uniref:Signal recognition particle protein n=1 Tax=secondary endosymbiont of Heteropsylla cubana TaxID=134287 RepID=J3TGI0_9ENTR|nr:signal recognition particle protein [secondary endosymbiont of Heteropsylla cubana]AFP85547.1 signal recognition particle subunit FFH/SRP54 (srp54) [secondary endosymbiont of Heteropsylla cubana]